MTGTAQANELDSALKAASGEVEVISATAGELQAFKDLLKPAFNGASSKDWQAVGYTSSDLSGFENLKGLAILQELPTAKRGRGFFAINPQAKHNWLLQAPHADSDLYTGKIASRLFLTGQFKAAQWNTVKRDVSDMAHAPNTYWQSFTLAFAEQYADGKIIQLHGYDKAVRKTQAGESSDMILSAGYEISPAWIQQTAVCLKQAFPKRVSLYPVDVQELGGTTNVQGQLLRSIGHNGFLHIEMSKPMRQELLDNAESRAKFINCL